MSLYTDAVLTLDPSTKFGWALRRRFPDPDDPEAFKTDIHHGTWKLGEKDRPGLYFYRLYKHLSALRNRFEIEEIPVQIVIEDTSLNAPGTRETQHLAESWVGIVELYCTTKALPVPIAVGVNSWRSAFIGRSMAPKEITGSKERRDWIKSETIKACEKRGLKPADDNQADALGILYWHINGGAHVLEQRRADRKAKTAAKRAQKRFGFGARAAA